MSAFVISPECMHRVVNAIVSDGRIFANYPINTMDQLTAIGQALFEMNQAAMVARYRDNEPAPVYAFRGDGAFRMQPLAFKVARYKAVQCLLYQCCEDGIDENPLFKALQEVAGRMASDIITDLPEWNAAPWGD